MALLINDMLSEITVTNHFSPIRLAKIERVMIPSINTNTVPVEM